MVTASKRIPIKFLLFPYHLHKVFEFPKIMDNSLESNYQKQPFQDVVKNLAIFTGKHLCCSLFLIKLQASKDVRHQNDANDVKFGA